MNCCKRYRFFSGYGSFRDFYGCKDLMDYYSTLDPKQTNPKHIEDIRKKLQSCPECNSTRKIDKH